jgi:glycosyltransferase involved in cell wall biosynthesis
VEKKLISIILPVYNGEKYLGISIESCLNQTYRNIELIIVNDCSIDGTFEIAKRYAEIDTRVKVINNEENKKLPASLNIGHKVALGDFMTWTSDDNFFELNALEELENALSINNADIVYADITVIDSYGEKVKDVNFIGFENIIFGNFIGSCFLYKKEVFERNSGYNENLFLIEDYDFWLRAIIHSRYFQLKKKLYNYRKHEKSLTYKISKDAQLGNLFKNNLNKSYELFCKNILENNYEAMTEFFTKVLTHQKITYSWIIKNDKIIENFTFELLKNNNFSSKKALQIVFFKKTLEILIFDQSSRSFLLESFFLIKKYAKVIDTNSFKTIIKYSFFK